MDDYYMISQFSDLFKIIDIRLELYILPNITQ